MKLSLPRLSLPAIMVLALVLGASTPAGARDVRDVQLKPSSPDFANPAMQTPAGRRSLCRAHLEKQGYPYAYLYITRKQSMGVVGACARALYRDYRRHQGRA